MKKVGIIFTGAIRECLPFIRRNILDFKECFSGYDVEIIFSTWNPKKGSYVHHGLPYVFDYDINELNDQIEGIVDHLIIKDQKNIDDYLKTLDKNPAIQFYQIIDVAKYLLENNIKYDYIVRGRHDNHFIMKDVQKYFDGKLYVPPCYHLRHSFTNPNETSTHLLITTYENFIKYANYDEEILKNFCATSLSNEHLDAALIKDIGELGFIDDNDILKFKNRYWPDRPGHAEYK